jgi:uncharacterized protein YceH (UPF0502 family)
MSEFTLQAIIDGDSLQLSEAFASIAAAESIAPEALRQQLAAQFFTDFQKTNPWDPRLAQYLNELHTVVLSRIANDDEFFCSPQHPLRTLLADINVPASHWCLRDTKPNQQLFDKLSALLSLASGQLAANTEQPIAPELTQAMDDFNRWLVSEDKRAEMLETRLCETELANLKLISAEARVIELINSNLAQRILPTELHNPIAGTLKSELQYWVFNSDPAALPQLPLWKCWQRCLPSLGQLFKHDEAEVDDQQLYSQIPALLSELERSLQLPSSNAQAYSQLIELFNHCLMAAIQKQPLDYAPFPTLIHSSGESDNNTRIPQTLLQQTDKIRTGDWLLFSGDTSENIRCKLALKNPAIDQLLFVDHTGRKVMIKSNKDFALCLSTGIARPLPSQPLDELISQLLTPLIARANHSVQAQLTREKQKAERLVAALIAKQQAAAEETERARIEEEGRLQEQLEARRTAARKAMAEARTLADEKQRRIAEQAAEDERLRIEQAAAQAADLIEKEQQARQIIAELQVGAWLEIASDSDPTKSQRAKLSVIISSTGKYIFADQVGRKLAEYTREQLLICLIKDTIKVVRNGDNFEDQLAKVIRGLRRDIS